MTKRVAVGYVLTSLAIVMFTASLSAQVTSSDIKIPDSYDTFLPPPLGGAYIDGAFGTNVKRVSDAGLTRNADQGGYLKWIGTEYSTVSPFNSDNSKFILLHQSYFGLYDNAGVFQYELPMEINSSSEPRWSATNKDTLYYHSGNQLRLYNVATGGINVVHIFAEYSSIGSRGEADISSDGNHFVFVGDNRFIFVYELSSNRKYTPLDAAGRGFDSVYMTADNNVTVSWLQAGTARGTGIELFDIDMKFLRQVAHVAGHMDMTRDTNGDEVLIWTNSADAQPIANCQNGIVKIRLADARQTCLLQLDWSLAVHISAPAQGGFVYVDTEAPGNPLPGTGGWVSYTNEILKVPLDGSAATRLAHHRSRPWDSYNWQPRISCNQDGSRLLYPSNYNLPATGSVSAEYTDTYLMEVGAFAATATSPAPAPAPPTAPASTVVRYEQTATSVHFVGTWFPNGGSFNSGGSAQLAMNLGSEVIFTFSGTAVDWIGYRDAWSGSGDVYLDGALVRTVNTYSASDEAQAVLFRATGLSAGSHSLRIATKGSWIWVDAFDVTSDVKTETTPTATTTARSTSGAVTIQQSPQGSPTRAVAGSTTRRPPTAVAQPYLAWTPAP